jgi:hypothetical protein
VPLSLAFALAWITVIMFLLSRLWMLCHKPKLRELPFITDITQGICPRCGNKHLSFAAIKAEPTSFWGQFNCGCGFAVKAHLKVD